MANKHGKWRIRIRKMKPEPITMTRRNAWGEKEKKTVWATLLLSFICITWYCSSRNQPNEEEEEENDIPTRDPDLDQIQIETVDGRTQPSPRVLQHTSLPSASGSGHGDNSMYPNILHVLDHIGMNTPNSQERLHHRMLSPLPGAQQPHLSGFGFVNTTAMAPAFPLPPIGEHGRSAAELEVTSVQSRQSIPNEQKEESDKKKKNKKLARGKWRKNKDTSIAKIPTVKEWAKQEENKRKAEKKQQKKELKKDKKRGKEMEKIVVQANKLKEAQKEKELRKAEKEASKAKKAAAKAEKAAAKAKEVAAKAEAKRKEKKAKLEQRLQQQLEESDEQLAAGREKVELDAKERKRKREDKAKKILMSITKTEEVIKTLQEKIEGKEKRVAQLSDKRDRFGNHASMLVIFKVHYKINDYKRRIYSIKNMVAKLKKKVEAKKKEIERLAPHLLEIGGSAATQEPESTRACSPHSNCSDENSEEGSDDESILDMLCGLDSDSECSDDEIEELTVPNDSSTQPKVEDLILQKAQENLQKMDKTGKRRRNCSVSEQLNHMGTRQWQECH